MNLRCSTSLFPPSTSMITTSSRKYWESTLAINQGRFCWSQEGHLHWRRQTCCHQVYRQVKQFLSRNRMSPEDLRIYKNECEIMFCVFIKIFSWNTPTSFKSMKCMTILISSILWWSIWKVANSTIQKIHIVAKQNHRSVRL